MRITIKKIKPVINDKEKNNTEVRYLNIKIEPYSARNKRTNLPLPYSTLKPLTNSLSPSAKSKGARFVSATRQINQGMNNPKRIKIFMEGVKLYEI